ncbi:MAG TPA: hypothetical protein VGA21_09460, partial [Cyclobacteriaceae bacterium]
MKKMKSLTASLLFLFYISCTSESTDYIILSPGNLNSIEFFISKDGTANYLVKHNNEIVIDTSSLGFEFKNQPPLQNGLTIIGSSTQTIN